MITIDKKKIKIIDDSIVRRGSFGSVNKFLLHDKTYAYKRFYSKIFLNGKRKKFDQLSKMKSENFIIPKFFVDKDEYLSNFYNGKNISHTYDSTDKITI